MCPLPCRLREFYREGLCSGRSSKCFFVHPRRADALAGLRIAPPLHQKRRDTRAKRPGVEGWFSPRRKSGPFRAASGIRSATTSCPKAIRASPQGGMIDPSLYAPVTQGRMIVGPFRAATRMRSAQTSSRKAKKPQSRQGRMIIARPRFRGRACALRNKCRVKEK